MKSEDLFSVPNADRKMNLSLNQKEKKDRPVTAAAFQRLLDYSDQGSNSEGHKYLEMRQRLLSYFGRKNCIAPEDRDPNNDHPYCRVVSARIKQDYAGGGRFNSEIYRSSVSDEIFGCPSSWRVVHRRQLLLTDYIDAEMVKAFLTSIEYRQRFGP